MDFYARLSPARLFVETDAEGRLAHDLVREQGVGGWKPPQRTFDTVAPARSTEHAVRRSSQGQVTTRLAPSDAVVLGGHDLQRHARLVDAIRPIAQKMRSRCGFMA